MATVEIELAEALRGCERMVQVPGQAACASCRGSGGEASCTTCGGNGQVSGPMRLRSRCPACGGSGRVGAPCRACNGSGKAPQANRLTVRIPPGADEGSRLRVAGRGEPGASGGGAGDLLIETHIRPHAFFRRDGLDLILRLPVTLNEAYNGAQVEVPTPTGEVKLRIPPRTQSGDRLRLRGRGVVKGERQGDLYAEIDVRVPDRADATLADAMRAAEAAYSAPVRRDVAL